jgi:hypothetical protein
MMKRTSAAVVVTLLGLACGDDGATSPRPKTPMTVWIFDDGVSPFDVAPPLPNVDVAFDPPSGGERIVRRTEADGHVRFEADFSKGGAQVSAFSADHTLLTMLDVSPESVSKRPNTFGKPESDLVVVLPRLDEATRRSTVELRGTLGGKRAPSSLVEIAASGVGRLGSATTSGTAYALRATAGRPFFLLGHEQGAEMRADGIVAFEHFESFRIDVPARDADGVLDIDLAATAALPVRTVHLRATAPAGSVFGPDTSASATVSSADSALLAGTFTKATRATTELAFDLEVTLAETDVGPERLLTRATLVAANGALTRRSELGVVADGTSWTDFLAPVEVPDASRSLADAIPLEGFPDGADLRIDVFANEQLIWVLHSPPGGPREKRVVLPAPFGVRFSADVQLFALSIVAERERIFLPPHGELYRQVAIGRDVIVRRR